MNAVAYVRGVGLWSSRYRDAEAFLREEVSEPAVEQAAAELLSRRARGRASQLLRSVAEVLAQLKANSGADPCSLPLVFASAFGELQTTAALLQMMHEGDGALSPVRFQSSVHNSAPGQLSIALRNPGFSTALAAGRDTVGAGLAEALGCLSQGHDRILLCLADERRPDFLGEVGPMDTLAVGFDLSAQAAADDWGCLRGLRWVADDERPSRGWATTPIVPALALVKALRATGPTQVALGSAPGGYYETKVEPGNLK